MASVSKTKVFIIENYLKNLGPLKQAFNYYSLADACRLALEGRGPPDLRPGGSHFFLAGNPDTTSWFIAGTYSQAGTNQRSGRQGISGSSTSKSPRRYSGARGDSLTRKLSRIGEAPAEGLYFDDAVSWLFTILAHNWLMRPETFDLKRVEKEAVASLA